MQITTPDIGVEKATVAEILVKIGDHIAVDDSIVLLESDKASVEVPSTAEGTVKNILIQQGDEVSEGAVLIELDSTEQPATAVAADPVTTTPPAPTTASHADATASVDKQTTTATLVEVQVPDIGVEKATVGDILVQVGEQVDVDQSLIVVESDKATVEVPSTVAGVVEHIAVQSGDVVKEGVVILSVKSQSAAATSATQEKVAVASAVTPVAATTTAPVAAAGRIEIAVPDLGVEQATLSEILVQVGDRVEKDQSLVVVESDKATVEVPSTAAGVITAIHVTVGQRVKEGTALVVLETAAAQSSEVVTPVDAVSASLPQAATPEIRSEQRETAVVTSNADKLTPAQNLENAKVYAGPAVRKLARELGVVLSEVKASGPHARLMKEDLFAYVKSRLGRANTAIAAPTAAVVSGLPKLPDFSAFGGVEEKVLTRLQQVSIPQLSLNNYIPQVTQFDLADITELEAWRNDLKANFKKDGISLTIMAFIIKAVAHLLKEEREFAGHLSDDGKAVLLRHEIHMGIAVATPDGLTVPVLRHPDQKSIKQIAIELGTLGQKARDKKLSPKDLQGANFTISSLGAIGGTAFTPLVNWPQVAILGISPASMQPVWNGQEFEPKLMLPLSLSYDHRVINGADAARFTHKLTQLLQDIRHLLI
ncbi:MULTISPECIES: 2-oxo acid dehydrogenase subunit E2 [unclassified Acinetobacter]|uniref:2-oxo acid dehydrogenase subunit E2 n=1 Tax=unclassified Acinetobacter TaxID=196816 RepID=UPI0029349ED0|nr:MULTISPECIES: 2-oxo acid dehydrogenase subunit E2 [unclassified Acinetobacter]WOE30965.1 2-oxo acid dehydrogenase subunit E2 [Acinetobacter sp. SAAs470]WOE39161.1 2-oxo acid dehydrogenase subunit E2 [Acinetobacter sp. SAAs474]